MKKFFVLILAILSTSVLSQQNYNSLKVKDFTNTNTAVFNTLLNGVAKLNAGVLSASPLVNADVSASAAISFSKLSGVVDTSTAQNISGNKSFLDNFSVTGTTTLATSLSGYLKATAGVVSSVSQVDLSTDVVGTLSITNGGTGSTSKSWVDLTTNQSGIAGNKAFTGNLSTSGTMLASNLSGTNTGDLITQGVTGLNSAVTNILEFPLNQIVTTATGTRRVDTGNGNVLANSSFESSTVGLGWQATNVTLANSTTNVQDGVKSIQITSTTNNWSFNYQSSLYPSAKAGQSAEGSLWVQSTGTGSNDIWLCEASYTATPALGPCDKYDGSGQPRQLRIYTPFKSTGSGIRLMGNTSGTVIHADKAKFDNREFVVSNYNFTEWANCPSANGGWTTNTTYDCKFKYNGDAAIIQLKISVTGGAPGGNTALSFNMPASIGTIDTSKLVGGTLITNSGNTLDAGSAIYDARAIATSSTIVSFNANASSVTKTYPMTWASGDNMEITFEAPIVGRDSGNPAVASESVQVSSDTMNFSFKTTAIVDSDPIGTYNTFYMNGGTNAYIRCTSSPTQTQANMNANGFQIFSRIYSASSTCAQPTRVEVKVPAGLKSINTTLFGGTGKTTPLATGVNQVSATVLSGTSQLYYPSAGILAYDAGYNYSIGFTQRFVDSEVNRTDGYFVFSASKYADVASIPVFKPFGATYTASPPTGTLSAAENLVTFTTKVEDTDNAYASGVYTMPRDGVCSVAMSVYISSTYSTVGQLSVGYVAIDNVSKYSSNFFASSVNTLRSNPSVSVPRIKLLKGQTVSFKTYQQGTSPAFQNDNTGNYFSINCTQI